MSKAMQTADKLQVISDLYNVCYPGASFFDIGAELAYTTQAILSGMKCELNPASDFVKLLKEKIPNHVVWDHIYIEPSVVCINCEAEVLLDQAAFCPPLNGWLGHNCCVDAGDIEGYYDEVTLT
jgi:hypothetical protein